MDLEDIGINAGNWVDSAQDRNYCECGIEPPGFISHGVSQLQPKAPQATMPVNKTFFNRLPNVNINIYQVNLT